MSAEENTYIEKLYQARDVLASAMVAAMANAEVSSYSENDSNGSVSTSRRSPKELADSLAAIDKLIEDYERKDGGAIHYMSVRLRT